jgi:hypothetical protein
MNDELFVDVAYHGLALNQRAHAGRKNIEPSHLF